MKVKQLLLHIGYPKTATTTLQEEVFVKLHNMGRINYLGRTLKSTDKLLRKGSFNGDDLVIHIRRSLSFNQPLSIDLSKMSTEKMNVISDENLTFHSYFNSVRFGIDSDPLSYPNKIKASLGNDIEVILLVTIRNQTDLIFSCFTQMYRFLHNRGGKTSFEDFISKDGTNSIDLKFLEIFNFNRVTEEYMKIFNTNCKVLFFEDIKFDISDFCAKLSALFPASGAEIEALFTNKHYRKKQKQKDYLVATVKKPKKLFLMASKIFGEQNLNNFFEQRYYYKTNLFFRLERRLFSKDGNKTAKIKIPLPSIDQRKRLVDSFEKSNLDLARKYDLDIGKMDRYGYINK